MVSLTMSSCPPHIASCSGGVRAFLSDAVEDLSAWLVTSVVIDFQLSLLVEVGSALLGLLLLALSRASGLLVYVLITLIVGHKIFFPAPVRASALSSRCFTLSRGCAAPEQSLSGPEQNLAKPEQPGRAPLWFPVWGPVCGLPNSAIVASCISTTFRPKPAPWKFGQACCLKFGHRGQEPWNRDPNICRFVGRVLFHQ